MALSDYNNNRTYTKYKRHVDDSKERISALDVNKIQTDLAEQQQETNLVKDTAFEERVYTIFENNLYTNAMFFDRFNNGEHVNLSESNNVLINYEKHRLELQEGMQYGEMVSLRVESVHGPGINLNDFFLVSNEYIPTGAKIEWYLENVFGELWPITSNKLRTPLHLSRDIENGLVIHARLYANAMGESPVVNGYALLYWDAKVELNLKNEGDPGRFYEETEKETDIGDDDGMTILIRDRAQEDKLVRVEEPNDTVELTYFWDTDDEEERGRLWYVSTHWPFYAGHEVTQMHKLYYGEYIDSEGIAQSVLKKIGQATDIGKTLIENPWLYREPNPIFDEVAAERANTVTRNLALGYGGDEDV